ncbi:HlyD family secretion protein [Loktanella salsilacus]|uniref:HlyD family secretion protein n=1 Tax=Loktanella salsilacus TaxID=195913 RepID=UPI0020B8FEB0|nr:HlyD family secretion protein [Loktanella salsilacus]UTH46628.1 HlyD family secretion protein [Loktanella salsilacus]
MARHDRAISPLSEAQTDMAEVAPPKSKRKRVIFGLVALAIIAAIVDFGHRYWTTGRFMVETDDAYVTADVTLISSRLQGYVAEVPLGENAIVQAGDVLVRLDDGDYTIALEVAEGRVASAGETLNRIDAQILAAQAGVAAAQAQHDMAIAQQRAAQSNATRVQSLASNNVAAQAQLDTATETLATATATVASADAAIASANAQVGVLKAQRAEAVGTQHELELAVDQAQRNLDLTVLRAPATGTLGNMTLEVGDLVTAGARLAALVPLESLYIKANFKETQMAGIAVGATVGITIDALPDATFEGTVESIAPATGSVFSLLPADNATGNFTKVVQRVPVRIAIPQEALDAGSLRAGLSVKVEVDSRTGGVPDAHEAPVVAAAGE